MKIYIVMINGAVITWLLRSQKSITLSVTEDEYSAITEVCCEVIFAYVILLSMVVVVYCPVTMHVHNVGALFLLENTLVSQCMKNIDVRHHFICDYI